MGHGWELYCRSGMRELGDLEVFRGLDKILGIALRMVQMGIEPEQRQVRVRLG